MRIHSLLIDLHYLPCIEYFACLLPYDTIYIEAQEHYQKQTYRNRCYILTAQKVDRLSVPIIKGSKKQLYTDIKIDYSQPWVKQHWRTICTAYGKSAYFEYLAPYLDNILHTGYNYLFELNWSILQLCLQILGMQKEIIMTDQYQITPPHTINDVRGTIHPAKSSNQSIYYQPFFYQQVFGTIFSPKLSIIDLLFCEGPYAYKLLNKHVTIPTRNY